MYSNAGSGMLGLEMSLHHHPNPHTQIQSNPQNPSFLGQNPHPQMAPYSPQDPNFRNPNRPFPPNSNPQQVTISDEDEPVLGPEDSSEGKRKITSSSPWQRMKWTDNMVKLLILAVYYIGDETSHEGGEVAGKKKPVTGGGCGVVLQKKGKWKSISKAMLERGFYVSPQQCEDKFNDLNKRYKRVNDILGKGTACRVVENQSLLDSMDHLTAKKKEEVKKLLNSKHLFFKEMCAYHTTCAGGGGCGSGESHPPEQVAELASPPVQHMGCHHSSEAHDNIVAFPDRKEVEEAKTLKMRTNKEEDMDNNYEDNDHRDDDSDDEDNIDHGGCSKKKAKIGGFTNSALIKQLSGDVAKVVQDISKNSMEKNHWVKTQMMQLEEKRVGIQLEAFEIEKQRLKWLKFSSKKERELERDKLRNEQTRLEVDRMILVLQQKELEILDHTHSSIFSG